MNLPDRPLGDQDRGFLALYFSLRRQIEVTSQAIAQEDGLALRRERIARIVEVVEAFGKAPSAELEAWALRSAEQDLEALFESMRAYILTGVADCHKLLPLLPEEVSSLKAAAARLECWGLYWQGNLLYARDRYAEAMSTFQRVLARDPEFPRRDAIFASLGLAWEHVVGDLEKADAMYGELIAMRQARLDSLPEEARGKEVEGPPVVGTLGSLELTPIEALALALERRGDLRMKRRTFSLAAADFREALRLRGVDPVVKTKLRKATLYRIMPFLPGRPSDRDAPS